MRDTRNDTPAVGTARLLLEAGNADGLLDLVFNLEQYAEGRMHADGRVAPVYVQNRTDADRGWSDAPYHCPYCREASGPFDRPVAGLIGSGELHAILPPPQPQHRYRFERLNGEVSIHNRLEDAPALPLGHSWQDSGYSTQYGGHPGIYEHFLREVKMKGAR